MASGITAPRYLPQHLDQHLPERSVLLGVDRLARRRSGQIDNLDCETAGATWIDDEPLSRSLQRSESQGSSRRMTVRRVGTYMTVLRIRKEVSIYAPH